MKKEISNENLRHVVHTFQPVVDQNSRILILGSVPSVKSMEEQFYYMHPQNRFWKILGNLFNKDLFNFTLNDKIDFLISNHIALYDSVYECDILGSSDNKIFNVVPSNIELLIKNTHITHIFLNGTASFYIFKKYTHNLLNISSKLPSTSPANATYTFDKLLEEWKAILDCYDD